MSKGKPKGGASEKAHVPKVNRAERAKKRAAKKAQRGLKVPRGTARSKRREGMTQPGV